MPTIEKQISESLIQLTLKTPPTEFVNGLQTGTTTTIQVNVAALERDLQGVVNGEVRFSDGDRGLYASDAGNYRMVPVGVVVPKDAADVVQTVRICRSH